LLDLRLGTKKSICGKTRDPIHDVEKNLLLIAKWDVSKFDTQRSFAHQAGGDLHHPDDGGIGGAAEFLTEASGEIGELNQSQHRQKGWARAFQGPWLLTIC
jgi:hypothetical protein